MKIGKKRRQPSLTHLKKQLQTTNMSNNTQLINPSQFNTSRIIFSQPVTGTIPNTNLPYKRVNISVRNPDGSVGDLVLPTERVFSFGVSETTSPDNQKLVGYTLPLCLWSRDGPSAKEKQWTDTFDKIVDTIQDHLISNREAIEKYRLDERDFKDFNPLYWKMDKGKVVPGTGPTLYAKLIVSKKHGDMKVLTKFYDEHTGEPMEPMDLIKKYCYVRAAVKIESVFVGGKGCALQVKLWEVDAEMLQTGMKRLLPRLSMASEVSSASGRDSLQNSEDEDYSDLAL